MERLVNLWIEHYQRLDEEDCAHLPLRPVYFLTPAEQRLSRGRAPAGLLVLRRCRRTGMRAEALCVAPLGEVDRDVTQPG